MSTPSQIVASASAQTEFKAPTLSRAYQCRCGRPVFLRNSECLACHTPLGYEPERQRVMPLEPAEEADTWHIWGETDGIPWARCANFETPASCNWLIPASAEDMGRTTETRGLAPGFCLACSMNRTIPDLSIDGNGELWRKIELGKRRLVSQLLALGLPVETRLLDPEHGIAFDLLSNTATSHVLTGHDNGLITLNVQEADDATRERIRAEMREPYRTLLGHFRHEIGHHYWDRLIKDSHWLEPCRALFGDERVDYAEALRVHYEKGPIADWALRYVSSYASVHPWEDWAETWAHYLHMADTLDTALSFGLDADHVDLESDLFESSDLWNADDPGASIFLDFVNSWVRLTNVLNELSRSMGQPDYYPFVLPHAVVGKLQFIHAVVTQTKQTGAPRETAEADVPAANDSEAAALDTLPPPSAQDEAPAEMPVEMPVDMQSVADDAEPAPDALAPEPLLHPETEPEAAPLSEPEPAQRAA